MAFVSILFLSENTVPLDRHVPMPEFFTDLNLDQMVASATADKDEYDLEPFFYQTLTDVGDIEYRQEVMGDLEQPDILAAVDSYAMSMRHMRQNLVQAEEFRHALQKQRCFLEAVDHYCRAAIGLSRALTDANPNSRGLLELVKYLDQYLASDHFAALYNRTGQLMARLSEIRYSVSIRGGRIEVKKYSGETDYGAEVQATFERFSQGAVRSFAFSFPSSPETDHVEAAILDLVARLYPDTFSELDAFAADERAFSEEMLVNFDREIQFYVAYLSYIEPLRIGGLNFCYPEISHDSKEVHSEQGFDIVLATKLLGENVVPVCNNFDLEGPERVIVVSGPNQGGKTTFARVFGQLHYLACLGCPVPGTRAELFVFDRLFTHFEREEDAAGLRGKLEDDLRRIHEILCQATPNSLVIMNEIFTSTTLHDANILSHRIAERIFDLDLLGVWVTFIEEIATLGPQTVSMVSTVVPDNPAQRTFEIVRSEADGLAYALSIAEKYGLTVNQLQARLGG